MTALAISAAGLLFALIGPIVLFWRAIKRGVTRKWVFRVGLVCYVWGWLAGLASSGPISSTMDAWVTIAARLTPFLLACVFLSIGVHVPHTSPSLGFLTDESGDPRPRPPQERSLPIWLWILGGIGLALFGLYGLVRFIHWAWYQ